MKFLEEHLASSQPELLVLWGRRRVGQTTLLLEVCARHKAIYFLATRTAGREQLDRVSSALAEFFGDPLLRRAPLAAVEHPHTSLART